MGLEDGINPIANQVESPRDIRSEEIGWHAAVLEKSSGNSHIQMEWVIVASINEKCERKDRFCICSEVSRGYKAKLWVCGDRVLNALESEFCGHGKVVEPVTKLVTEGSELSREIFLLNTKVRL
jgi:hypothetical protein